MFPMKTKQNKTKQKTEQCALGRKKKYLINCIDLDTFYFSLEAIAPMFIPPWMS